MDFFIYFFLTIISLCVVFIIFRKPYLGFVFMFSSLPLSTYTELPWGLDNFTSVTSVLGGITIAAYITTQSKLKRTKIQYDPIILLLFFVFYFLLFWGEFNKPVSTGFSYPFTYLQIALLLLFTPRLFNNVLNLNHLMVVFIGASLVACIFGLNGYVLFSKWGAINRFSGLQGNANEFGIYLSVAIIMLLTIIYGNLSRLSNSLAALTLLLFFGFLILSGSRGAILFLIPVSIFHIIRLANKNIFTAVNLFVFIFFFILILQSILPSEYFSHIYAIPTNIIEASDTVGFRYEIWKFGLNLWADHPVLGIGTGMFNYFSIFSPILHGIKRVPAHNMFVTILVENGIVGLTIIIIIIIRTIKNLEDGIKHNPKYSNLIITIESIFLIFLLNGIKANLETNKMLWFCVAFSMVIFQIRKSKFNEFLNESN
jgi:O-antigen ligase